MSDKPQKKTKVTQVAKHTKLLHPALLALEATPIKEQPIMVNLEPTPSLDLTHRICVYILVGGYPEIAAQASGLSPATWQAWLARGSKALNNPPIEASELLYADLVLKVRQAVARSELRDIARIDRHGRYDWKAAMAKLKTRHSERWDIEKRQKITIAGDPEAPLELVHTKGYTPIDVEKLDLASCEAILAQLEESRSRAAAVDVQALPAPSQARESPQNHSIPPESPPPNTPPAAEI